MQTAKCLGDMENYSIYMLNGKMGLAGTPNGEKEQVILTQPKYSIIYPFVKGYAIVKAGDFYGVINKYGVETIPANRYKYINPNWKEGYYFVSDNHFGDEHYLDAENNYFYRTEPFESIKRTVAMIGNIDYQRIFLHQRTNDVFSFSYNNKVYVYNKQLNKIILRAGKARFVNGDKIIFKDEYTNKEGIIDLNGRILASATYDELFYCADKEDFISDNLIEARKDGKSGYIDFYGNVKIPFIYYHCGTFQNGYAWVCDKDYKCGLIDKYGNVVEPLIHDSIEILSNGNIIFIDNNGNKEKYYLKDKPRDFVTQDWKHISFRFNIFNNPNYVGVKTNERKSGVTYIDGRVMLPAIYDDFAFFQEICNNGVIVAKKGKYGVVDLNNKELLPFMFDYIDTIEEIKRGDSSYVYYKVGINGLYGVYDNNFRECIPVMYSSLKYSKSYKCFVVEVKEDKAMIDLNNNIVVPFTSNNLDTHDFYN